MDKVPLTDKLKAVERVLTADRATLEEVPLAESSMLLFITWLPGDPKYRGGISNGNLYNLR